MKRLLLAATVLAGLAVPAYADTVLKLTEVITSPERTETLKGLVATFEKANPGTKVEITSLPWGEAFEKFATMVSAGETPDVVEMPDTWLALYGKNGALESLEPYLKTWQDTSDLNDRALQFGRAVDNTAYTLPYGFYLRALFYNKKLFQEAGIKEPPKTMEDFHDDAAKVAKLPGKSGYCMRGGPGGLNGWVMFGATMAGDNAFFKKDGTSTFADPGWVKGLTFMVDLYKNGLAPKDSVNWGFNEIVAGFYSGTCAMLDQDPDALIAIDQRMKSDEFGVAPMPKGPSGKAFPTIGYAGWSMFANSSHKDLAWKLIATLEGPEGNIAWNKRTGALPALKSAEKDPFYAQDKFKGWFAELNDKDVHPTTMPTDLPEFAFFKDSLVIKTSQQALLGEISPEDLAKQWADYLTAAKQKQMGQ
ncbi:sugar ABC transporter substrate-binding protein [Jiella sp. MQZ9-1]|uniref:Sugar ABC transporter substrate-binding protein n=1 Tax=Jiella flava TaxID=2816857 RepID=A0A939G2E9_9HYPH|nr:sugar ABC transporter substrate-binding protein [Jiella flava]MBO0663824.1 sugar ABC transporter substrate-binding protein [Jiella flava]MCD2472397.1 sugar ABC transporter substrate-binding protein [Jiella flava]